jgi:hypothetical protein
MYIRRKCYSSLYDDLYNDYLYDKYFSDIDNYDYYDQREFAMTPIELAKLVYRGERELQGHGYADILVQKQLEKLENMSYGLEFNPKSLLRDAKSEIDYREALSDTPWYRRQKNKSLRNKNNFIKRKSYDFED